MVTTQEQEPKPEAQRRIGVGLPADVHASLEQVCIARGWSKVEAVKRMVARELADPQPAVAA